MCIEFENSYSLDYLLVVFYCKIYNLIGGRGVYKFNNLLYVLID